MATAAANESPFSGVGIMGLGTPLLVVVMLVLMIIPLPPFLLDVLFTFNIALSLLVLLAVVYSLRPLEFAVFPTVLLVATLLRLALNVASTRVVLLHGHEGTDAAGKVIQAFGDFVIGGNYTVGLVVFSILIIINFVVVTKGAGRISEVSARFTLDAMPGKQMAVDADLNSGVLTQDEAKERRENISREADFYGAMDGASKFVKGDAIAGILILLINIIGGFAIGMLSYDLSFERAAENYVLLTIGDGLVAQIPSLVLSVATAIMVTRVSDAHDMGQQIVSQLVSSPRALMVTGGVLFGLGVVPGMPNIVFLLLSSSLLASGYLIEMRNKAQAAQMDESEPEPVAPEPADLSWADVLPVDVVGLQVGYRLISLVDASQGGELLGRIKGVRKKLSQENGFLIQPVHIKDNLDLDPNGYRISLLDVPVGEGKVYPDKQLAIDSGQILGNLQGIATKDPSFGLDAVWIDNDQKEEALAMGYTVVDAGTVVATHLSQLLKNHAHELLGHEEVQHLLDQLANNSPRLVENLTPKLLPLGVILKVLQNLLAENLPIRDIRSIAEALAEHASKSQEPDVLTSHVRISLGRMIYQHINGMRDELAVVALEPKLEQILLEVLTGVTGSTADGSGAALEPGLAERMMEQLGRQVRQMETEGLPPVLVVGTALRQWLSKLLRPNNPSLHVLSYEELPGSKQIRVVATVGQEI